MNYKNKESESVKNIEIKESYTNVPDNKNSNINDSFRKKYMKYSNRKINILALILFIISYYCYYLSLEKCFDGIDLCTRKWNWIMTKLKQLIISVIIINFNIVLIIYKIISKFHLFHFIIAFVSFYNYSHSLFYYDHGAFNLIFFFFLIFLFMLLLLIIKLIICILRIKSRYKLIIAVSLIACYYLFINPTNCDDWGKGLNNTYIENDDEKYGCKIVFPKRCYYKILHYSQDINRLYMKNCKDKEKNAKKKILKKSKSPYVNKNTTKFGFPLTNEACRIDDREDIIAKNFSYYNILDMDKPLPSGFKKPEYIVDFSKDPYGELILNVNYDEELSKERKKLEQKTTPYSENIMIIYLDAISRANSIRKLKKTLKFFENFMSYKGGHNEKYPNENFHSFQFFKYHAFYGHTSTNFPILFYGNKPKPKDYARITKYLKQIGYVTGYASDYCSKDNIDTKHNLTLEEVYDHQLLMCDPNVASYNIAVKKCLYGNINCYYLHKYIDQFWRKYQNNRKFAMMIINDAHEGTLELAKYSDDVIYNFLNSLYNDNLLKDTTVFLLSDHGCNMPSVYYLNDFFQIEKRLPMLFMIINDRKNMDYYQQYSNIHENQQTLITGYDIYNTIGNLIYGDNYTNIENKTISHDTPKSPFGQSLFDKINAKERNPKNFSGMEKKFCI